jgi:hypothetical protein
MFCVPCSTCVLCVKLCMYYVWKETESKRNCPENWQMVFEWEYYKEFVMSVSTRTSDTTRRLILGTLCSDHTDTFYWHTVCFTLVVVSFIWFFLQNVCNFPDLLYCRIDVCWFLLLDPATSVTKGGVVSWTLFQLYASDVLTKLAQGSA